MGVCVCARVRCCHFSPVQPVMRRASSPCHHGNRIPGRPCARDDSAPSDFKEWWGGEGERESQALAEIQQDSHWADDPWLGLNDFARPLWAERRTHSQETSSLQRLGETGGGQERRMRQECKQIPPQKVPPHNMEGRVHDSLAPQHDLQLFGPPPLVLEEKSNVGREAVAFLAWPSEAAVVML